MAAIIYLTNPWSYRLAIIPYVEGALSCYTLLALCAGLMAWQSLADEDRNAQAAWRWFLLTGWFAGSAMACKYPGLVSVVIPLGAATVLAVGHCRGWFGTTRNAGHNGPSPPSRSWTPLFAFAVGFAVTMGPWLVKNLVETGNPVYPLAYRLFGGADWNAELDARWTAAHRPPHYDLADLGRRFLEVTIRSDWLSPLLFGLAPLAALAVAARRPPWLVRGLWLYVGYLFATWWLLTHRLDRFWVPLLPFVAWLAGIGATWTASAIWITIRQSVVLLALLFNLGYITTSQCGLSAYLVDLDAARQFCEGTVEPVQYLNFLVASGRLAPDSKVLLVGESQAFDARVSLLYNTAFDQPLFDRLFAAPPDGTDPPDTMPANWPLRPAADIRRELADQGITHVMVSWEAILRYRTEVGYSDFVTLANVKQLVRMGLLRHNDSYPQGLRDYDAASAPIRREIDRWAPELRATRRGQNVFVAWQLWETAVDGR